MNLNLMYILITGATLWSVKTVGETRRALRQPPDHMTTGRPVSVIIPTFNEEKYLPSLLASIQNQTYEPIEIIVADCNSDDATIEIARSFGVKVVLAPGRNPASARNAGAEAASADYILFIDADMIAEHTLVETLIQELLARHAIIAHPKILPGQNLLLQTVKYITEFVNPSWRTRGCILITKEAFQKLGGYREILSEDVDIGRRCASIYGVGSVIYIPDTSIIFSIRRTIARWEGRINTIGCSQGFPAVRNGVIHH